MLAVLTGANGFVGSHLVDYLLKEGYRVRCIVRGSSSLKWLEGKNVELFKCGLDKVEPLKEAFKDADFIYHIAGVVNAPDEAGFMYGNVTMTQNVLEAALAASHLQRLLVVSSLAASGPAERPGKPVTEDMPCRPVSLYGKSKVAQEQACEAYHDRLPITIIRPPAIYGPRDTEVLLFFKTVKTGVLPLLGFQDKTLSFVHVADLVRGMEKATRSERSKGQAYFLGSVKEYSWQKIGSLIGNEMGRVPFMFRLPHFLVFTAASFGEVYSRLTRKLVDLNIDRARQITSPSWFCSSEKAMRDFGYEEQVKITDGIKETLDWYRKEKWL